MDLLTFQHHHHLNAAFQYAPGGALENSWGFWNPQIDAEGNVDYYGFYSPAFFTAWDCNGPSMLQGRNPTQQEFMKLVH